MVILFWVWKCVFVDDTKVNDHGGLEVVRIRQFTGLFATMFFSEISPIL
jgi:hypothetical protein